MTIAAARKKQESVYYNSLRRSSRRNTVMFCSVFAPPWAKSQMQDKPLSCVAGMWRWFGSGHFVGGRNAFGCFMDWNDEVKP